MENIQECEGYKKLLGAVMSNVKDGGNCFNPEGCNMEKSKCFHRYCDKLKWIIGRAGHYAEKTGLKSSDILNSWESDRDYWYMNYYQEANQPEIKDANIRVFDSVQDLQTSVMKKGFRCPSCGGISKSPYTCDTGLEMSKGKICDWKAWGLFGTMGEGISVFVKDRLRIEHIFMPVAWE